MSDYSRGSIYISPNAGSRGSVVESNNSQIEANKEVVLQNTVKVKQATQDNRYDNDYMPTCGNIILPDPLILYAFQAFLHPLAMIKRKKLVYSPIKFTSRFTDKNSGITLPKYRIEQESINESTISPRTSLSPNATKSPLEAIFTTAGSPSSNKSTTLLPYLSSLYSVGLDSFLTATSAISQEYEHERESLGGIMCYYEPDFKFRAISETIIGNRETYNMWEVDMGSQYLFQAQSLSFILGDMIEPMYCSIAIYDLKSNVRVSEEFAFDMNTTNILTGQLSVARSAAEPITLSRACIFKVTDTREGLAFVLRIYRVLQGDPEDLDVYYLKDKPRTPGDLRKLADGCKEKINRLSSYRQLFAIGVIPLFNERGDLILPAAASFDKLFLLSQPPDEKRFFEILTSLYQGNFNHKLKQLIRAKFEFSIRQLDNNERPYNVVDQTFIPLKQAEEKINLDIELKDESHPNQNDMTVKEIEEFPVSVPPQPYLHYVHNLYVYPIFCQFSKYRNVSIKVQLRTGDESLNGDDQASRSMKGLYGGSSSSVFVSQLLTGVSYHQLTPNFLEEIKVMLPYSMSDQVHLFFTFYQVACQHKIGKGVQEVIGYSLLRLYPHARIINNGDYNLPIASKLPENKYLMGFISQRGMSGGFADDFKWYENGQPQFTLRLRLNSTIFNQDQYLTSMFQSFPDDVLLRTETKHICDQVAKSVENLRFASPDALINFLTPVYNFLLNIIGTGCALAQIHAFYGLVYVTESVTARVKESTTERVPLIMTYIQNIFTNPPVDSNAELDEDSSKCLYVNIIKNFYQVIQVMDVERATPFQLAVLKNSWLWLEIAFKSLILDSCDNGSSVEQLGLNHVSLITQLEGLLELSAELMSQHRKLPVLHLKHLNANLAVYLMDLFCVMSKGNVVSLIEAYCDTIDAQNSVVLEIKCAFIQIMVDHDWFIEICTPYFVDLNKLSNAERASLSSQFKRIYPLPHILTEFVVKNMNFITQVHRARVIEILKSTITKFDFDNRFQDEEVKAQIAGMFFPLIPMLSHRYHELLSLPDVLQRNLLCCWLWIFRYCPRDVIKCWWVLESNTSIINGVLQLLEASFSLFEFPGKEKRSADSDIKNSILSIETIEVLTDFGGIGTGTVKKGAQVQDLLANLEKINANHLNNGGTIASAMNSKQTVGSPITNPAPNMGGGTVRGKPTFLMPFNSTVGPSDGNTMREMRKKMMGNTAGKGGTVRLSTYGETVSSNSSKKDSMENLVNMEMGINQCISRLLLSIIVDLVNDKKLILLEKPEPVPLTALYSKPHTEHICLPASSISMLTSVLKYNIPDDVTLSYYPLLNFILVNDANIWFDFIQSQNTPPTRPASGSLVNNSSLKSALSSKDKPRLDRTISMQSAPSEEDNVSFAMILASNIEQLCRELLKHASYSVIKMRSYAVILLYDLIRANSLACAGNLTFIQNILTTALSNSINSYFLPLLEKHLSFDPSLSTFTAANNMMESLEAIIELADVDVKKNSKLTLKRDYVDNIKAIIEKACIIFKQSLEIARQERYGKASDPTQLEDLLTEMADVHAHLPEVRISWLRKLATHQQNVGSRNSNVGLHNHAEAGQCLIEMSKLMETQATSASFVDKLMRPLVTDTSSVSNSTPRHILALLEACQELDKAQLYEQCYDIYQPCLLYYLSVKNYESLSKCHLHIHQVMEKLVNEDKTQQRLFGTYYRVGFYGTRFGEQLHGREFIYKKQKICRLPEITTELKEIYGQQLGTSIKVHPNSSPIDINTIDLNDCLLQITVLKPIWPDSENLNRISYKEKNTDLTMFMFSTPFTMAGGTHGEITAQMKRNTTIYVDSSFPSIKTRQLINRKNEVVLSPSENVAEDITLRTTILEEQLRSNKIELKNLQPTLHGMLLAQVNGGTMPLCKAFLGPEYKLANPTANLQVLRNAMSNLLIALESGVEMHNKLSTVESDQEMQRELEMALEITKSAMKPYLIDDYSDSHDSKIKERKVGFASAATVAKVMKNMSKLEDTGSSLKKN